MSTFYTNKCQRYKVHRISEFSSSLNDIHKTHDWLRIAKHVVWMINLGVAGGWAGLKVFRCIASGALHFCTERYFPPCQRYSPRLWNTDPPLIILVTNNFGSKIDIVISICFAFSLCILSYQWVCTFINNTTINRPGNELIVQLGSKSHFLTNHSYFYTSHIRDNCISF